MDKTPSTDRPSITLSKVYSAADVTFEILNNTVLVNMENTWEGSTRLILQPNQAAAFGDFMGAVAHTAATGEDPLDE